jgi:hypothetical protein
MYHRIGNTPVWNGGMRNYDEEWPYVLGLEKNRQERDYLDGLAQAHLVCQDGVLARPPLIVQPAAHLSV